MGSELGKGFLNCLFSFVPGVAIVYDGLSVRVCVSGSFFIKYVVYDFDVIGMCTNLMGLEFLVVSRID